MQIGQAKEYFELGIITGFETIRDPLVQGGWLLVITGKEGRSWTLETKVGKVKTFASMDTLIGQVEQIAGRVSNVKVFTV